MPGTLQGYCDVGRENSARLDPESAREEQERRGAVRGWGRTDPTHPTCACRDSMDSVKQSAALCLLRLYKASPDLVPMGEWTARVVHLLNDQHMVRPVPLS